MYRTIVEISVIALVVSFMLWPFASVALPFALSTGLLCGIPIAFVVRRFQLTAWWYALLGSVICLAIVIGFVVLMSEHSERAELYESMFVIIIGVVSSFVFWQIATLKSACIGPENTGFPTSVLILPVVAYGIYQYQAAREPIYLSGCITHYEVLENPTSRRHSRVSLLTEERVATTATMTVGYSNPDVVGNCASISKTRKATLLGYRYMLHSPVFNGCATSCRADR